MRKKLTKVMGSRAYMGTLLLFTVITVYSIVNVMKEHIGLSEHFIRSAYENSFLWSLSNHSLMIALVVGGPLITGVVCSSLYSEDEKNNVIALQYIRESKWKYHRDNIIAVMIASALLIIVPLLINYLISASVYPSRMALDNQYGNPAYYLFCDKDNVFSVIAAYNPMLYEVIIIVNAGILFALFSVFDYCLSYAIRIDHYLCSSICMILWILVNTVPAVLGYSDGILISYIDATGGNAGPVPLIVQMIAVLVLSAVMFLIGAIRDRYA